ncbi:MAG: class A beta-lactamase, partial [Gemmatimonadetes bacterium]|nr:class A beta-lactamase [Gemmatimonadota bacterium]
LAVPATLVLEPLPAQQDPGLTRLEREITRLAALAGGRVGVGAVHLPSGRALYLNGDERFPMASSYKVPIAVQLLTRVERGEVSLDTMIALKPSDLHPGSGTLTELFDDPGVILSLRNLIELMLLISDNSATDLVLRLAGGSSAVTARMSALGLDGIRVDRPTVALIADWIGVERLPSEADLTPALFRSLARDLPDSVRERASRAFNTDPRDTATPRAMATLLQRLWRGEILKDSTTALLLDIMRRSTTGAGRIKGMLRPDVEVAHKTGTIGGTTNDVGIMTLPDEAGQVAVAIFVKESTLDVEKRERAIAHIARAIYDYFTFNPRGSPP